MHKHSQSQKQIIKSILSRLLSDRPKPPKSKEKKKTESSDKDRPGFLFLLAMIVVFYVCGSIVQWNLVIVFCLSVVFGAFVYWFGSQHDVV